MDEGTNALDLLSGHIYPLKLGYYGVRCRSQQNIIDCVTIEEAIARETKFFAQHPDYASLSNRMGVPYLAKRLNVILIAHIKRCIPSLNTQI